jgi:hypothetical protein
MKEEVTSDYYLSNTVLINPQLDLDEFSIWNLVD